MRISPLKNEHGMIWYGMVIERALQRRTECVDNWESVLNIGF